ncbi:MAG: glycosyltransferase [Saprospirales bacterium]|nr:glycosyltransferase [Saprospirales bacterium]
MKDKNPLVSVLIPAYNASRYLAETIHSVMNQTFSAWEMIIVDDGSQDDTFSIAREFAGRDSRIQAVAQPNAGASAARNHAFRLSKGQWVKYMDADDLLNPDSLAAQAALANQFPDCIISGKWGRFYRDDLQTFRLSSESVWRDMPGVDWIVESWSKGPNMTQPGIFLIPRNIVEKFGGWDESLSLVDDREFFTRIILQSPFIKFCPDSVLYYRSGLGGSLSKTRGEKAMASAWKATDLSANYLLQARNDAKARRACAVQYQAFAYNAYPGFPELTHNAEARVRELGGSDYPLPGGLFLKALTTLIGWKKPKR